MKNYIEFTGENLDIYSVKKSNIISFIINGKDYREFIKGEEKDIYSYKLITNKPILQSSNCFNDFEKETPAIYYYMDFCYLDITIDGKTYEYGIMWVGNNDYYSYGQDVRKEDDLWIYTSNTNIKPSYFKTYDVEMIVKNKLNMHFNDKLMDSDISKIEELYLNYECVGEVNDNFYDDLSSIKNLKKLEINNIYLELDYKILGDKCKNIETLEIRDVGIENDKFLTYFPNLKMCYIEIEYCNSKNLFDSSKIKLKEYGKKLKQKKEEREDWILYCYNCEKIRLERLMKMNLINEEEYKKYISKIKDILKMKLGDKNDK